jgi:branched-chain amino acid transport system substrate-binding protein
VSDPNAFGGNLAADGLAAKQSITEQIYRYCRGLDRMDLDLALSVWHDDGTVDFGAVARPDTGLATAAIPVRDHFERAWAYRKQFFAHSHQATNVLIEAMIAADSVDPAKFLPSLKRIAHVGATGRIEFDDKGDRKDAEMTIFTVQAGKVLPVAIVKSAKIIDYKDFAGATGAGDR